MPRGGGCGWNPLGEDSKMMDDSHYLERLEERLPRRAQEVARGRGGGERCADIGTYLSVFSCPLPPSPPRSEHRFVTLKWMQSVPFLVATVGWKSSRSFFWGGAQFQQGSLSPLKMKTDNDPGWTASSLRQGGRKMNPRGLVLSGCLQGSASAFPILWPESL